MSDAENKAENDQEKTGEKNIFGTSVSAEYVEKRLAEALGTSLKFGSDLKLVRLGVGQVRFQLGC